MMFTGFFAGPLQEGQLAAFVILDKDIIVTRFTFNALSTCSPPGTISLIRTNPIVPFYSLDIAPPASLDIDDSGPLSIPIPAGTPLAIQVSTGPQCGLFGLGPQNVPVTVQYVMQ
jgi:hypothetical protein